MTGARYLLETVADDYLKQYLGHPLVLQISARLNEDPELFKLVIRRWMKQSGKPSIPVYRLESICEQVGRPSRNHNVAVHWCGSSLRLFNQQLWLQPEMETAPGPALEWPVASAEIELGGDVGRLTLEGPVPRLPAGEFRVGNRRNMEETVINQGDHHKSLKNLFQSAGIPPWLRDLIPLCEHDGELVAMGDWCFSKQFESWMSESGIRLVWQPLNPLLKHIQSQQSPDIVDPAGAVR
jgi:tRNA(Ile)-lysidine synthase